MYKVAKLAAESSCCPVLEDLPPPSLGKTGWPWTEECQQLPETMHGGKTWPKVSIVMPSYNQADFIEESIRSVLLQGYPDLELIIIDASNTDGTLDIIRKYEKWLSYWVSEPDHGQSNAINKGLAKCTGKLFNWHNSDDVLMPGRLSMMAEIMVKNPDASYAYMGMQLSLMRIVRFCFIVGVYLLAKRNSLLIFNHFTDLGLRLALIKPFLCVNEPVVYARSHPNAKTYLYNSKRAKERLFILKSILYILRKI